jgi:hypothetical protein
VELSIQLAQALPSVGIGRAGGERENRNKHRSDGERQTQV